MNDTLVKEFIAVLSDYCHWSTRDKEPDRWSQPNNRCHYTLNFCAAKFEGVISLLVIVEDRDGE